MNVFMSFFLAKFDNYLKNSLFYEVTVQCTSDRVPENCLFFEEDLLRCVLGSAHVKEGRGGDVGEKVESVKIRD